MALQADIDYSGGGETNFLDKRKFRAQQTPQEKTIKALLEALEKQGVQEGTVLANELIKMKNIYQLNKDLLCLVYRYFQEKNFSLQKVTENFDEDFQEQLRLISKFGIFRKLKTKFQIYKFRQDFIIYLFLISEFFSDLESSSSEGYDSTYDNSYEEILEEEVDFPADRMEDYGEV